MTDLVERLDCLHVWPQSVADHYADTLTPRQIKELYAVGDVATAAKSRIEQLEAALTKSEALQDLAYYNGAKQYAAISAQSEDAARDWLNGGCGNRQRDAIAALGETK